MSKKLNRKDYIFGEVEGQELIKLPGQIAGNSFLCRNLKGCTVFLCDLISTIYVDDCIDCRFFIGPVKSSIFMRECKDCSISVASGQLRISDSTSIKAFVHSETDTTLENVENLIIGPYNFTYPGIAEHFRDSELDLKCNSAFKVLDFTPKPTSFSFLPANKFEGFVVKELGEVPAEQCPVDLPTMYGGFMPIPSDRKPLSDEPLEQNGMFSFSIKTSAESALKTIEIASSTNNS